MKRVKRSFGETLLDVRKQNGLSQQRLADLLFVNRSSVANWEAGRRLPDAAMIAKIASILEVDISELLDSADENNASPLVIMVDDNKITLSGGAQVIEKALPWATVVTFCKPSSAIEYARANNVSLAFLDIELGTASGIELCKTLTEINPHTNVIFLTAYEEYSFEAWNTSASGFMLKPITSEGVRSQLKKLRHPFPSGGAAL